MKSILALAAIAIYSVSSATAAELAVKSYTKAPEAIYDWTGFYIGGHAGYGWGNLSSTTPAGSVSLFNVSAPSSKPDGGFGGGQIGYNYQFHRDLVIGLQGQFSGFAGSADRTTAGDFLGLGVNGVNTFSSRMDWFGSVTGRLGYAADNLLFYGKGGAAWARARMRDSFSADLSGLGLGSFGIQFPETKTTLSGWTAGGGVEYGLTQTWTIGIEYNYYDFGSLSGSVDGTGGLDIGGGIVLPATGSETLNLKQTLSVVQASLNYRF